MLFVLQCGLRRALLVAGLLAPLGLAAQPGTLQFKALGYPGKEGGPAAVITVSRLSGAVGTVSVDFATEDGTARADADYVPTNGTLTFGPGVTTLSFTVAVLNDPEHEEMETVTLHLRNAVGGALGGLDNATLTLSDNDPCAFTLAPVARTHGPEGGTGSFVVNATPGCPWTISEAASWLGILGNGTGNGSNEVVYTVDSNPSTLQRSVVLRVGGKTFTVTQRGVPPPDLTRPVVTMLSPAASARVTNLPLVVTGRAGDAGGVMLVEYRLENSAGTNAWQPAQGTTNWMIPLAGLPPGANTVRLRATDAAGNSSVEVTRTFNFVVVSPLTLLLSGEGSVTPALHGRLLEVGRSYTVTAVPRLLNLFSNWTGDLSAGAARLTFRMETNLQFQANFVPNPFRSVRGLYNGLFLNAGPARHESAGFFTATTTDLGAYSAKVTLAGQVVPLSGRFALDGRATNVITRAGLNPVTVLLQFEFGDSRGYIAGTLSDGNWSAELRAHRVTFHAVNNRAPQAGRYTVLLPGDSDPDRAPAGTSFGALIVDAAGRLTFTGTLADGTPVVQKVPISPDGEWPLFVRLYNGGGELVGWENFSVLLDRDVDGTVLWNKPAQTNGTLYPNGFSLGTTLTGARYQPPTGPSDFLLSYTNVLASFAGGNLAEPFDNAVLVKPGNVVVNLGTNRLVMTVLLPSGLFSGSVAAPGGARTLLFKGALHLKSDLGAGFFPGFTQGGRVLLGPSP